MNGGTPLWGVQPTDLRRATTERRGCQDDCEYSTQYSISTAQLCLWDGCAQLMLCSGSCGTESQSWGMSSVLCSAPLTTATAPPRQNPQPAKCPYCPARLPKMQKDQAAPRTSPIPQNGPIPSNASGSVLSSPVLSFCPLSLPVSANNACLLSFCPLPRPVQFPVHVINTCRSDDTAIQWLRVPLYRAISGMAQVGSAKDERRTQILSDHLKKGGSGVRGVNRGR